MPEAVTPLLAGLGAKQPAVQASGPGTFAAASAAA
jgi:hypothetical protein